MLLPDGEKLWDATLRRIDEVLDDEGLVDLVEEALGRRCCQSRRRGRPGTPAEVALRMLVLKHLYDWSFEECEREVRGSLVYRAFCRIGCEAVPDEKTLIRLAGALGPEVLKRILERLVVLARKRRVVRGLRLRVDTTVVETNIHYPTDSSLLADGVRVITRTVKKLGRALGGRLRFRDRSRSVARRVFAIVQQSRQMGQGATAKMKDLYQGLMGAARAVVRQAERAIGQAGRRSRSLGAEAQRRVQGLRRQTRQIIRLTEQVLAQTKARVLQGNTHYPHKLLSVFETHTEAIRKGKAVKPTEFGKLVKIQESEGFITDYEVCARRVPDGELWVPSLERHEQLFGRPPRLAVGDAAFASAANERAAVERGVERVALPRRGRLDPLRRTHQQQRWFRRALRWRTGCEGRISVLKRRHGLRRCRYRGPRGIERWVGMGIIAAGLYTLGRATAR
jgi:IS5 family transposase